MAVMVRIADKEAFCCICIMGAPLRDCIVVKSNASG